MADQKHLKILRQGVEAWNRWRKANPEEQPFLSYAELQRHGYNFPNIQLSGAVLRRTDLSYCLLNGGSFYGANLIGAKFHQTKVDSALLEKANLDNSEISASHFGYARLSHATFKKAKIKHCYFTWANLTGADFSGSILEAVSFHRGFLFQADFRGAKLVGVDFSEANLMNADFRGAQLDGVDLHGANLLYADFEGAELENCIVFGISAWNVNLKNATQSHLIITPANEPTITVDNIEVAQFIYLLLNNQRIRHAIDTITSRVVLILGRFTPERKHVLDEIRLELHRRGYLPVLFDFDKPDSRTITETISTLAHLARFIIADISEPKSIPQELQSIVPHLPSVPIQPLRLSSETEYGMFEHFKKYPWVLNTFVYNSAKDLIKSIAGRVIEPAEAMAKELKR